MNYRAILYHNNPTSARLRFLLTDKGVCLPQPLPKLAAVHTRALDNLAIHPAHVIRQVASDYGFDSECLRAEEEYHFVVEVPDRNLQILLLAIDTTDPPIELVGSFGGRFIDLTQARGLTPVELELLRGAYELILGG